MGIDINDYPAIRRHLLGYGRQRLEQSGLVHSDGTRARKKTLHSWYELQDTCAYHEQFSNAKLFWMDMSPTGRFCYSEEQTFSNDKAFLMTGQSLKYLCAVLNSSLITWWVTKLALTTGAGLIQWKKFTVESISVPRPTPVEEARYSALVDELILQQGAINEASKAKLDQMVFDTYVLSEEQRNFIRTAMDHH